VQRVQAMRRVDRADLELKEFIRAALQQPVPASAAGTAGTIPSTTDDDAFDRLLTENVEAEANRLHTVLRADLTARRFAPSVIDAARDGFSTTVTMRMARLGVTLRERSTERLIAIVAAARASNTLTQEQVLQLTNRIEVLQQELIKAREKCAAAEAEFRRQQQALINAQRELEKARKKRPWWKFW